MHSSKYILGQIVTLGPRESPHFRNSESPEFRIVIFIHLFVVLAGDIAPVRNSAVFTRRELTVFIKRTFRSEKRES